MVSQLVLNAFERAEQLMLSPGSLLSVWSFLAALIIASGFAIVGRRGRPIHLRALIRAMFPSHRLFGASGRADIAFTVFAVFASASLFGWAVLSHLAIADTVAKMLGTPLLVALPVPLAIALTTFVLWLAYEFAYWFDHLLSHKIPALWAFHKVHHSAETLSPLTVFRVHPVDSIVFYNIVAVVTGVTAGVMHWLVGAGVPPLTVAGTNVMMVAAIYTIKHLHHSHVWIAFTGPLGRLILSPAHHQIHHSVAPEHHDRNFGETLALFDWLAGTLHIPQAKRQPLAFGVEGMADPHGLHGALVAPFGDAVGPFWQRTAATEPQTKAHVSPLSTHIAM